MIIVITGVPGSGKSLYAMQLMEEQLKKGREVYSDIDGCTLPGVQDAPDDWRTLPDGSYCVYDEAHQKFPATGKAGLSADPRVQDLDTHRHHGYDLVYITQASTRLHHDIRKLAGRHVHVQRNFGANTVTLFMWERAAMESDKQERLQSDQQLWHYPKRLYRYYKSATVHTHKRRIPKKLAALLGLILCLGGYVAYSASHNAFIADVVSDAAPVVAANPAPVEPVEVEPVRFVPAGVQSGMQWASNDTIPAVAGCISSDTDCRCYSSSGLVIDMTLAQCRVAMRRPLPIGILGPGPRSSVRSAAVSGSSVSEAGS